ncbi:hypothetical protein CTAYLR_009747 [Chrysophaeum taylorii]|uniref:Uncharacterized protein n=1 Tax=Chrysophaeum taylorii TaxID=2483200 RepID=A0AAD7XQC0_9STRA|nr:hypothetical protein CTAYLR_009747 [Chrysophaeum taylorii]
MNRLQEVANALTQLIPSIVCLIEAVSRRGRLPVHAWVLMISVWLHLPFSFFYHVRCALRYDDCQFDAVRCWSRRLDNTFIHISATCIAYGTSHGSLPYVGLCAMFNLAAAATHWRKEIHMVRNQRFTLVAIILYIAPIAWRRDLRNLLGALAGLFPAGFIFRTYIFGGYSHAIFHLFVSCLAYYVMRAALTPTLDVHSPFVDFH